MLIYLNSNLPLSMYRNYRFYYKCIISNVYKQAFRPVPYRSSHSMREKVAQPTILSLNTVKYAENEAICKNVQLIGWVQSIRKHKSRVFFNISDGSSPYDLQVITPPNEITDKIKVGSALSVEGDIYPMPNIQHTSSLSIDKPMIQCYGELHAKIVHILDNDNSLHDQSTNTISLPFQQNTSTNNQLISSIGRHSPRPDLGILQSSEALSMRHRLPEFGAMLRIRAYIKQIIRQVMSSCDYLEVDTPILTSTDCEGTGQMFNVQSAPVSNNQPKELNNNSSCIYLTGSAQMHLESLALGLSKVYTLNPTFRAENSNTRHHLAEFYMLEAESIYLNNINSLCEEIELIIKKICNECLLIYPKPECHQLNALQKWKSNLNDYTHLSSLCSLFYCCFTVTGMNFYCKAMIS
ncbi:unnamed protein product [Schistosoma turkestanicum]|nr:unnamed protein product [Schistosoma turkestanicum]